MLHTYTGLSLKELKKKFGIGGSGFYSQTWYEGEPFFTEKPPKGEYEIYLGTDLVNMTFAEQKEKLPKGFEPVHTAIIVEAILTHYQKTGERLLENICVRISALDSDGYRVDVGRFDGDGLVVNRYHDDSRDDSIGVSGARKLEPRTLEPLEPLESLEDLSLERAIEVCKQAGLQVIKQY